MIKHKLAHHVVANHTGFSGKDTHNIFFRTFASHPRNNPSMPLSHLLGRNYVVLLLRLWLFV